MAAGRLAAEGMLDTFSLGGRLKAKARHLLPLPLGRTPQAVTKVA